MYGRRERLGVGWREGGGGVGEENWERRSVGRGEEVVGGGVDSVE
jgi:hypothetical protein